MIVKKAKFKKVRRTVTVLISDDVFGCDQCRKIIGDGDDKLDFTVFCKDRKLCKNKEDGSDNYSVCSWKCFSKIIRTIKCDYFVSMPFLHFDKPSKAGTAKDFFKILK